MKNDFMMAINQVCHERQLAIDIVLEAVEVALASAYKRNFGSNQSITAQIDTKSGEALIFLEKVVVEQVENEKREISLKNAKAINPRSELGGLVSIESTPKNFGRIAAQTAKQVILQRIREAERDALYSAYAEREGEIVSGTVHKVDPHQVTLSLGKAEAILPRSEQIASETYKEGQRLRSYVASVSKTSRGPQIILSRTHRDMLRRLLEVEVPEIYNGTVEIKSIAREAGHRSKVAVAALQEGVDPVGSCVGMRGTRIQNIVNELNGEKIDVVQWNPDLSFFIANSLSPAKVMNVMLHDEQGKTAVVVVPDKQLSLAIGKEGQNARLAAKLTGWRIDIKSASEAVEEALQKVRNNEAIRGRMSEKTHIFNLAASILEEKAPIEFSDGELNLLSEAIEVVNFAEMSIERERRAALEEARKAARSRDILAEAEAILSGRSPLSPVSEGASQPEDLDLIEAAELQLEAEGVVDEFDEEEESVEFVMTQDVDDILAEAEAMLSEVEFDTEPELEAALPETEVEEVTAEAAESIEAVEATEETAPEMEAQPEAQTEAAGEAEKVEGEAEKEPAPEGAPGYNWQEQDEYFEDDDDSRERELEKKKARQKKRRLVYDERLGQVVAERRRKRSRRTDDWFEEYDE
ncbi:MAG: transcription termination/antitermination protein NusA [Anaerolineae bacterium]|nr:transcription termination/antitermination protein NusA [Anaerolineae bacterium]